MPATHRSLTCESSARAAVGERRSDAPRSVNRVRVWRLVATTALAIIVVAVPTAWCQTQTPAYPLRAVLENSESIAIHAMQTEAGPPVPVAVQEPMQPQAQIPVADPLTDIHRLPEIGSTQFSLAEQPRLGANFFDPTPRIDPCSTLIEGGPGDFGADSITGGAPFDSESSIWVYRGKTCNRTQRPLVECGRPWFESGQLCPSSTIFGCANLSAPQFTVFGDFRVAAASNQQNGDSATFVALEANLNFDLKITATERFLFFISPLDQDGANTRWLLDEDDFEEELDPDVEFGFFEGDMGAIVGGWRGQTLPFDLPFAVGFIPLVIQNGTWLEDAFAGLAVTIPARNSPRLDIPNMDFTFFWGFDGLNSPAFDGDDNAAKVYGIANFIEAYGGYWELDYAYLEDRDGTLDRSYSNIGLAYTRRYGRWLSNSVRFIGNAGQSTEGGDNTADGFLLSIENSLISTAPATFVPYCNLYFGSDRPQSVARDPNVGGILRNTGILFESDGMTGYPTLDASANDTYGAALGINLLSADFGQQLVLESAFLQVLGNDATRIAPGDQYGIGLRYQRPLSNALILRLDGMLGFLENAPDLGGARVELRYKF